MILECKECGNPRIENRELGLCSTCNRERRKEEERLRKVKVVTPIKKVSQKRAVQIAEYVKLKREYIALYPACEVPECNLKAVEIHHQRGKEGDRLTDVNYFMSVCRKHHEEFTEHSRKAIEDGHSHLRTKPVDTLHSNDIIEDQ